MNAGTEGRDDRLAVDAKAEQPIEHERDERTEGQRVDSSFENDRSGYLEAERAPPIAATDPQQEQRRDRDVKEQVDRAAAGDRIQRARDDVGAVDAAGEQDADFVREQQREDE